MYRAWARRCTRRSRRTRSRGPRCTRPRRRRQRRKPGSRSRSAASSSRSRATTTRSSSAQRKYATAQLAAQQARRFLEIAQQQERLGQVARSDVVKAEIQSSSRTAGLRRSDPGHGQRAPRARGAAVSHASTRTSRSSTTCSPRPPCRRSPTSGRWRSGTIPICARPARALRAAGAGRPCREERVLSKPRRRRGLRHRGQRVRAAQPHRGAAASSASCRTSATSSPST